MRQVGLDSSVAEADIQALVHEHPEILPIDEIDPMFTRPVPVCRELSTPAGQIDNLMITPTGLPVIVECKLWRNAEARREVVGQILDYAKELRRWSSSDLQREVCRRLKRSGDPILELVRKVDPDIDEAQFNDALTGNLRRGRFLLLIVGDGIRENVEAIAEYLQEHAGLHFSLGLVELPIYLTPDGGRLVAPRVLARTVNITRYVVASPDGYVIEEAPEDEKALAVDPQRSSIGDEQQKFWQEFLDRLMLDDPEQPKPRPPRQGFVYFSLPVPKGCCSLLVYREINKNRVGLSFVGSNEGAGEYIMRMVTEEWESIKAQLGDTVSLREDDGRWSIADSLTVGPLDQADERAKAFEWLGRRVNAFVNVLRPRIRSATADYLNLQNHS